MSSQVRLRLLPKARCLFDDPVQVKVTGLRFRQVVTMRARSTDEKGEMFSSSATYTADENGEIDLNKDPSLSGTYVGVEPMGLLWSMKPDNLHKRFQKTKSQVPHVVKFSVHEEGEEGKMLAEVTNERLLMADGVSRVPIKEGNIHGVLFTPPGKGPFPAVLDLSSFMSEKRGSLLASKGFVVLTAAVYNDKPANIRQIHLDHFEEAVDFLRRHPKVGSKGVGVISRSKGGDIALSLAAFVSGIEAVVWINGCCSNVALPLYYKKRQILSPLKFDSSRIIRTPSGAYTGKNIIDDPRTGENKDSLVPVEKAEGPFLFVASEDDLNWDSKMYMDMLVERLKHHGKHNFECICYPGAGHSLQPPYEPFCHSSFHSSVRVPILWGGEPQSHSAAEVHMWKKIQEFFRVNLSCDAASTKSML